MPRVKLKIIWIARFWTDSRCCAACQPVPSQWSRQDTTTSCRRRGSSVGPPPAQRRSTVSVGAISAGR